MKKLTVIALAALSALVFAATANAKEMSVLRVCGADGCNAIKPALSLGHDGQGPTSAKTPAMGEYYVVKVGVGDGSRIFERWDLYFVPSSGAVLPTNPVNSGGWSAFPANATTVIRKAAKGLKPFRVGKPSTAYIADRRSADAAAYADLLGQLPPGKPDWYESPITIAINWPRPNPWSKDGALLTYLPKAQVLMRGDGYFKVPDSIASRIDRERRGLSPVAPGAGFPWGALAGGLAGALAVAGALVVLVRRRRPRAAEGAVPA